MGIVEGGKLALLAAAGPMGLGAIDYVLHADRRPGLIVVTDVDEARLARAAAIFPPEEVRQKGIELVFVNTSKLDDVPGYLKALTGGSGFDDVHVYAPVRAVVEQADQILGRDGCLNFFAGPTDTAFSGLINYYNVHYNAAHVMGTTGGNTQDMIESLRLTEQKRINPAVMVTHIGGLNCVAEATLKLPEIPGGKKLIYSGIDMELTAIDDFAVQGQTNPHFAKLAEITARHKGLWSAEAEHYLLEYWGK